MVRKRQRLVKRYGKYQIMVENDRVLQGVYYYATKDYQLMVWEKASPH